MHGIYHLPLPIKRLIGQPGGIAMRTETIQLIPEGMRPNRRKRAVAKRDSRYRVALFALRKAARGQRALSGPTDRKKQPKAEAAGRCVGFDGKKKSALKARESFSVRKRISFQEQFRPFPRRSQIKFDERTCGLGRKGNDSGAPSARFSLPPKTQGIGLRPLPWAVSCGPLGRPRHICPERSAYSRRWKSEA